jgi:hypothetical protein
MSVFNNGLLGFAKQVADIQSTLDGIAGTQTILDDSVTIISDAISPFPTCGPWMTLDSGGEMNNQAWYGLIVNDPTTTPPITGAKFNVPYGGQYLLVGSFGVNSTGSGTNILNFEFRVRNETLGSTRGNGYLSCGNFNNPAGIHTGLLGSCMAIPFSVPDDEVEDDFVIQGNNWSDGTYSSNDNAFVDGQANFKVRWVYLGNGTL